MEEWDGEAGRGSGEEGTGEEDTGCWGGWGGVLCRIVVADFLGAESRRGEVVVTEPVCRVSSCPVVSFSHFLSTFLPRRNRSALYFSTSEVPVIVVVPLLLFFPTS